MGCLYCEEKGRFTGGLILRGWALLVAYTQEWAYPQCWVRGGLILSVGLEVGLCSVLWAYTQWCVRGWLRWAIPRSGLILSGGLEVGQRASKKTSGSHANDCTIEV